MRSRSPSTLVLLGRAAGHGKWAPRDPRSDPVHERPSSITWD
jgi:hypothetical protein